MKNNRFKTMVLTLVLASMIISGCSNGAAATETTTAAAVTEKSAVVTEAATTTEATEATEATESEADGEETAKESATAYLDVLRSTFKSYLSATQTYTDDLEAEKFDDARKDLDEMEKALDGLAYAAAPEKYSAAQEKLRDALSSEYNYVRLGRKFLEFCEKQDSLTEEDGAEVKALTDEMADYSSDFAEVYMDLVKTVAADLK